MANLDTWYQVKQGHEHTRQVKDAPEGDAEAAVFETYQGGDKLPELNEAELEEFGDKFKKTAPPPEEVDLDGFKKSELLEVADDLGISNKQTDGKTKAELKTLIEGNLS